MHSLVIELHKQEDLQLFYLSDIFMKWISINEEIYETQRGICHVDLAF